MTCRLSSIEWAETFDCKRKQSLYGSSVEIRALVNSLALRIWNSSSSWLTTSKERFQSVPLVVFFYDFFNFLSVSGDYIHKVYTACSWKINWWLHFSSFENYFPVGSVYDWLQEKISTIEHFSRVNAHRLSCSDSYCL